MTWADVKGDVIIYAGSSGSTVDRSSSSDDEVVSGLGGAETLIGGSGTNLIIGAAGNDNITGGSGSNTYLFRRGDGDDVINEDSSAYTGSDVDVLRLGTGIALNNVSFTSSGNDLIVEIEGTTDSITLAGALDSGADRRVEFVEFADGRRVSIGNILNEEGALGSPYIRGTSGNDSITLDEEGGVVESGAGNDIIHAGGGDSFVNGGSGNDIIYAGTGRSIFAINVGAGERVENFTFVDGTSLSFAELLEAGVNVYAPNNGVVNRGFMPANERIYTSTINDTIHPGNNNMIYLNTGTHFVYGEEGETTIVGGLGSTTAYTGAGSDTLVINRGRGTLLWEQYIANAAGKHDRVVFGQDMAYALVA